MHVCTGTTAQGTLATAIIGANANRVYAGRCGKCNGKCSCRLRIHTLQSSVTLCAIGSAGPRVPLCSPREHAGTQLLRYTLDWLAGWLAGWLQHVPAQQRTQWLRIPQAAADCFGCGGFQMFQTQLDDALRVHQRELNIARDNYSHEIKERRRSAQPSNRLATCMRARTRAHARARTHARAPAAAHMRLRFVCSQTRPIGAFITPLQAAQHRARAARKHPRVCARTPIVRGREKPPRLPTGPRTLLPSPHRSIHLK